MVSATKIIMEYVCPALGTLAANQMFYAPFKDVQKAIERGSLGDLNPLPWAFMLGNCFGWLTYSVLINVRY
jgi:solute carrier family 50 (sugar transporter)